MSLLPTPRQIEYQSWERGVFLHFGLRTFYEGWKDFDERSMLPERFNPTELSCDQWAETARRAGFRYMVMTAKHHDGFALWPSKTTDFSVASSPWKNGKGDVVKEFLEACRRHDIRTGIYYSPFDAASPVYGDEKAYDDYFITQISEILEPYGQIDILWFDGCGSEKHEYDWRRIVGEIRRMQPNILIFNIADPDFRWVGNEDGYADLGTRNIVDRVPFSIQTDRPDIIEKQWLPAECDCRMRERNWFYSNNDVDTVKPLGELMGMYYYSCGRGANLLINVGPDRRGLLPAPDAWRLIEFGEEIDRRFEKPFARLEDCTVEENRRWIYQAEAAFYVDHAVIGEDIAQGERVMRFAVRALTARSGRPITLCEGTAVGYRQILAFPVFKARRVWLEVEESDGEVRMGQVDFLHVGE
ncbi:alpha-L-fucosidase [bacterium]|nr:alpha-L-fucosidase [bacterium]